jgi:hypothetical protein
MYKDLPFTTKVDGCYYTFSLTGGWERTRYHHLVASRGYKVNVFVPGKHARRTWLLELQRYQVVEDAWNGQYDLSKTTFESYPIHSTRFGKMEGWHLIAGMTRAGRLTLRQSNGKRFNWWIPVEDIKAAIDSKHATASDQVTVIRGQ